MVTYNVNFGTFWKGPCRGPLPAQAESVLTAVRQSNADVVLLQETNAGWECAFESLRDMFPYQHFHNDTSRYYAAGSAVLAASSITVEQVQLSVPEAKNVFFAGMVVQALFMGRPLDIANVHLRPPLSMGDEAGGVFGNGWVWWDVAPEIHQLEVEYYLSKLRPDALQLVVGDFNEGSYGGAYQSLARQGWTNALDASSVRTTWEWPLVGSLGVWGSYDHVFCRPSQLAVESCEVGVAFRGASDHLPVTAVLALL